MITITVLKNPFNYDDKEIHTCEYIPGKTAYQYIQPYIMGFDGAVVSVNGNVLDEDVTDQIINVDDCIAVCPVVGKNKWWGILVGLLVGGITGAIFKTGSVFGIKSAFWSGVATSAVSMVGGAIVNQLAPSSKPDRADINVKSSYNWANAQARTGQGNALAVTYGNMRTSGQLLAQHISSFVRVDPVTGVTGSTVPGIKNKLEQFYSKNASNVSAEEEKQYINLLLSGGEGPIDSISDVRINNNPISYYKDVEVEIRLGESDQGVIGNFNDVYDDQPLAYELDNDGVWATQQTDGNAVEGLEITLDFPGGLYYINDKGELENASVEIEMQYRKVGEANWNNSLASLIRTNRNTAFFRSYRVDRLSPAQYEVRVRCINKSGTSTRHSTRLFWTQLSGIMYDDFVRPGKVLVAIRALATSQLSGGMPSVTWVQTRNNVWVWNPKINEYEQKSADNPAWAAYDMIHRCRKLKNVNTGSDEFVVQGAKAAQIVYQDFANWAAFCDEKGLTFNYIFDTASDLWTSLQKPEGVGRGKVVMRGTKFGSICDAPSEPVQLFTVGNIVTDKFKEVFVGLKDRANAIEVSFSNKDKAYERDIIIAYADDYNEAVIPNITQISMEGITTVEQAYREAKYRLRLNKYLVRTVEHSADIDAIACQLNDVVLLAHDVPQWGYSGRLFETTATTLQLDREVTLEPYKSYAVALQITNMETMVAADVQSIVTVAVQGVSEEITKDTINLVEPLAVVPQKWDLYSFGETNKVVKPFRVLDISRDQDLRRKITCIEYIEEIYNEATDIPEVNYSALDEELEVSSVSVAEENYRQKDGTVISGLNVAWNIPRSNLVRGYKVFYSNDDGGSWHEWSTVITGLSTSISGIRTGTTYLVKVCTVSYTNVVSPGVTALVYVTGKDIPPSNINNLAISLNPVDLSKVTLSWSSIDDVDLAGYRIREGLTLVENLAQITTYNYTATENRKHLFSVTAVDNSGNESAIPAMASIITKVYPDTPTGFSAVQNGDYVYLSWNKSDVTDIMGYEIRQGTLFDNGALVKAGIIGTDLSVPVSTEMNYRYHVKAINNVGNYSEDAATAEVAIYGLTPKNVILSFDEMMLQSGTHINTEFGSSWYTCLTLPGRFSDYQTTRFNEVGGVVTDLSQYSCLTFPGSCIDYPTTRCNELGGSVVLKLQNSKTSGEYLVERKDLGEVIKVNLAADFVSSALLSSSNSATLWFRHSRDGNSFEDWKVFVPVTLTTRYIDYKVVLTSDDLASFPIEVGTFTCSVDVDDVERTGSANIAICGSTVIYSHMFLGGSGPENTPIFTPTAIGAGLRAEVISVGLSSAVVRVVNAVNGTDVGGTITYRVKGYGG